jgi:hypothetical protein
MACQELKCTFGSVATGPPIVYRADGHLWLCHVEDRAGQDCEGSKLAVESIEDALNRIIIDTEA